MMGFSIKATCVASAICAFFFAASGSPLTIEQDFADYNCAITFPAGWRLMTSLPSQPNMTVVAAYANTTGRRIVGLAVYHQKPTGPMDDRFIAKCDQELGGSGRDNRVSGKFIKVGGIECYQRTGALDLYGKHISTMNLFVPGQDQYLVVIAMRSDGDVSEDPEIQQAVASFRFLHPFVPTYAPPIAFRIAGFLMAIGLIVALVVYTVRSKAGFPIVIIVVVALIVYSAHSHRTPRHSQPPPLPSGTR